MKEQAGEQAEERMAGGRQISVQLPSNFRLTCGPAS
jgi:hypothetical protein